MAVKKSVTTPAQKSLLDFTSRLTDLSKGIGFSLFPVNFSTEREKFFYSKCNYNPQYKYKLADIPQNTVNELNQIIDEVSLSNLPINIKSAIIDTANFLTNAYNISQTLGSNEFLTHEAKLHDWYEKFQHLISEINISYQQEMESEKHALLNAEHIKSVFEAELMSRNLSDWSVEINQKRDYAIYVSPRKHIIGIGQKVKRTQVELHRLIVHEIHTHVVRKQKWATINPVLRILTKRGDKMLLEEGLAVYNEYKTKRITEQAKRIYLLRLLAVRNLHLSFSEIFELLKKHHLSNEVAYTLVHRVKRGVGDTSLPGGYKRDSSYALGYELIKTQPELADELFFNYSNIISEYNELFS